MTKNSTLKYNVNQTLCHRSHTLLCFLHYILRTWTRERTWLLPARLHFVSLKMKFIYSIITHFSKLFPYCQHNLLPSAQLWMVDGYLIGETTSHWAEGGEDIKKKREKRGQIRKRSRRSHLLSTLCSSADKYEAALENALTSEITSAIIFRILCQLLFHLSKLPSGRVRRAPLWKQREEIGSGG